MNNNRILWWGYLHTDGSVQVKRLFQIAGKTADWEEAKKSPFVELVVEPFPATSREEAIEITEKQLTKLRLERAKFSLETLPEDRKKKYEKLHSLIEQLLLESKDSPEDVSNITVNQCFDEVLRLMGL